MHRANLISTLYSSSENIEMHQLQHLLDEETEKETVSLASDQSNSERNNQNKPKSDVQGNIKNHETESENILNITETPLTTLPEKVLDSEAVAKNATIETKPEEFPLHKKQS